MVLLQKKSTSKRDFSQNIRCVHNTHRCLRNLEGMGERERVDLEDLRDLDYMDVAREVGGQETSISNPQKAVWVTQRGYLGPGGD